MRKTNMVYELFISLRYLKAKRKQTFISIITLISVGGVAIGVTALVVVLSVMDGMHEDLRNKILGTNSHVIVMDSFGDLKDHSSVQEKIKTVPHVTTTSPFVLNHAMLNSGRAVSGVVVRGIDPKSESRATDLSSKIIEGSLDSLIDANIKNEPGIILGVELSRNLGVFDGDKIDMVSPFGRETPMGTVPKLRKYRVVGIFKTGMYEYDSTLALVSLDSAQKFFSMGESVSGIEVKVDDIYIAKSVSNEIEARLGSQFWTKDWIEMNRNLFSALKLEKIAMFIILTLIILVAAFNIISTLIMMVMEKGRDIAILKSMGATKRSIMRIFMLEGIIIGVSGTALGCAGGFTLCKLLQTYEFIKLPSDIYQVSTLPVKMNPGDITLVAFFSILITFLATIYPAWNAARQDPIEALRYE